MPLQRSNGTTPQTALKSRWSGTAWASVTESRYDGTTWQPANSRTTGPMPTTRNSGVNGKGTLGAPVTLTPTRTAGDTLLLFVFTPTAGITFTTPGYTQISTSTTNNSNIVATRTADGTSGDAVTITPSATAFYTALLVPLLNVGSVVVGTRVRTSSGTSITLPALTTDSGNQLLIDVLSTNNTSNTLAFDAAETQLGTTVSSTGQQLAWATKTAAAMGVVAARVEQSTPTNATVNGWPIQVKPT